MFNKKSFTSLAAALLSGLALFSSCSTELDPNAEYKETIVIYSLLDPNDSVQTVKVNKAFLNTNSNALTIAANYPDSSTLKNIVVTIEQLREDSSVIKTIPLHPVVIVNIDSGIFYNQQQVVYQTDKVKLGFFPNNLYRVKVVNQENQNMAYGVTDLVETYNVSRISRDLVPSSYDPAKDTLLNYDPGYQNYVRVSVPANGRIYKAALNFKYKEKNVNQPDTTYKNLKWNIQSEYILPPNTPSQESKIDPGAFFRVLLAGLSQPGPDVTRKADSVTVTVTMGNEILTNYYQVNNAFSIVSQTLPSYDNITNGTGLVASRQIKKYYAKLTKAATDSLVNRTPYKPLRFVF